VRPPNRNPRLIARQQGFDSSVGFLADRLREIVERSMLGGIYLGLAIVRFVVAVRRLRAAQDEGRLIGIDARDPGVPGQVEAAVLQNTVVAHRCEQQGARVEFRFHGDARLPQHCLRLHDRETARDVADLRDERE